MTTLKNKVLQDVLTVDSVMGYIFIEKGDDNYMYSEINLLKLK